MFSYFLLCVLRHSLATSRLAWLDRAVGRSNVVCARNERENLGSSRDILPALCASNSIQSLVLIVCNVQFVFLCAKNKLANFTNVGNFKFSSRDWKLRWWMKCLFSLPKNKNLCEKGASRCFTKSHSQSNRALVLQFIQVACLPFVYLFIFIFIFVEQFIIGHRTVEKKVATSLCN